MQMPRPTEEDKARFRALVPDDPRIEVKPMFGQLGAFLGGHMFAGLFGADVGVKLPEPELAALRERGARPYGPPERPMSGYVTVPDDADAAELLVRGAQFAATLPPKVKKKP
ncbi:TfoX/Sxy family protein [Georgenia yuyongxinii]|uniref:TfoX/Sxy family protein n=2 Tax=Georgenia yuyongxinii TaxID=2589797 RepID=A0A5B8C4X1_9MICO|nr:TfoX/Sxy family protein [Georgenia yuyongxinii]